GSTDAPNQYTAYAYDALDNLIYIAQGAQHRYFKYDSLSRLTYERQVEQEAPHYAADSVTGNSYWSRRIDYNSQGLVQDAYDARQIHTHFDYDGLNRVGRSLIQTARPQPTTGMIRRRCRPARPVLIAAIQRVAWWP